MNEYVCANLSLVTVYNCLYTRLVMILNISNSMPILRMVVNTIFDTIGGEKTNTPNLFLINKEYF